MHKLHDHFVKAGYEHHSSDGDSHTYVKKTKKGNVKDVVFTHSHGGWSAHKSMRPVGQGHAYSDHKNPVREVNLKKYLTNQSSQHEEDQPVSYTEHLKQGGKPHEYKE